MQHFLSQIPIKWNYKKWKIEKGFQAEVFKYLRSKWWICYHIQDIGMATRFLDGITITPEWKTIYIEFKKTEWLTFNFSQFEPSQVVLLADLSTRKEAEAYVMIYSNKTNTYTIHTYNELLAMRNDRWGCKLFSE